MKQTSCSYDSLSEDGAAVFDMRFHFSAQQTLRLRIKGRDIYQPQKPLLYARHEDTVNRGQHRIWTGGDSASWLQIPVLRPAATRA